ncbi:unnamed protein product [Penicillium olsonii]|nr:unnamed protein product [Penicillium olsonii]CAG7932213.1 unnamed protein product [Penicillium olsonii]
MDDMPQTDCSARTDREVRSSPPPSFANSSTDYKPQRSGQPLNGFFLPAGDVSSPSDLSPTSNSSFARQLGELVHLTADFKSLIKGSDATAAERPFGDDGGPDGEDVSAGTETVRKVQFLLRYGDYAGVIWNCLRRISRLSRKSLPESVALFERILEGEDGQISDEGEGEMTSLLRDLVIRLQQDGAQIDYWMARAVIRVYADRNQLCHNARVRRANSTDIIYDAREVERLLPDKLMNDRVTWERIVRSCADLKAWLDRTRLPDQLQFQNIMPTSIQQKEFKQELDRGLRKDRLDQMYGKDGEAKRLKQPCSRPDRAQSDPVPYVPTMDPVYSPSRRYRPVHAADGTAPLSPVE